MRKIVQCTICKKLGEEHHVFGKKAHPKFIKEEWNLIPLCREHHTQWHSEGTIFMANRWPSVKKWLSNYGWFYLEDGIKSKWNPPVFSG